SHATTSIVQIARRVRPRGRPIPPDQSWPRGMIRPIAGGVNRGCRPSARKTLGKAQMSTGSWFCGDAPARLVDRGLDPRPKYECPGRRRKMRPMIRRCLTFGVVFMTVGAARADGPAGNLPDNVRPIPPRGIAIADADRTALRAGVDELGRQIDALRESLRRKPDLLRLLPDVQVYHKAVHDALEYGEFYKPGEVAVARDLLKRGLERAAQLRDEHAPWDSATGLVVRGYTSKIDGSGQPYGLVVPKSYRRESPVRFRLDVWCHGRGENLTELSFIDGRQKSPGEFTPRDAFVLHPYGRYCNANKFAGEIDLFEALEDIKSHYPI